MTTMIREEIDINIRYEVEGLTANEFLAYMTKLVSKVPLEYRDTAKVVDLGYDDPSYVLRWARPQTEQERIAAEREDCERGERRRAESDARDRAEYERLKAKFETAK